MKLARTVTVVLLADDWDHWRKSKSLSAAGPLANYVLSGAKLVDDVFIAFKDVKS